MLIILQTIKKVAELDIKQSQLEEVIKAQKVMLDSQQILITRLQQQVTGLEANASRNYNYKDEIAQATCTSIHPGGKYVYAVRRQCSAQAASCEELCKSLGNKCRPTSIDIFKQNHRKSIRTLFKNNDMLQCCTASFCNQSC